MIERVPRNIDELIDATRTVVSHESLEEFVFRMRAALPGPRHRHQGVLSGQGVQDFQNWLLIENYRRRLTDGRLLAIMRAEFPQASGAVFTADIETGLRIVRGIRAHFNRDGHNGPSPRELGLPPSSFYGAF